MKVYLAGRFDERERVKAAQQVILSHGHVLTADWTDHKPIARYGEDLELAASYAAEDLSGVIHADAVILLTSELPGGTGVHAELGAAIAHQTLAGRPAIFVVGPHFSRSMMYFHPAVRRVESLEAALAALAE